MTCIAVLGMHAGGTSVIAKALHWWDIPMGTDLAVLQQKQPYHPQGQWEDRAFKDYNKAILNEAVSDWLHPKMPASFGLKWVEKYAERWLDDMTQLIKQREYQNDIWGFKDPRTCLIWSVWRRLLGDNYKIVMVWRNAANNTDSLWRRGDRVTHRIPDDVKTGWDELYDCVLAYHDYMHEIAMFTESDKVHKVDFDMIQYSEATAITEFKMLQNFLGVYTPIEDTVNSMVLPWQKDV